MLALSHPSTVLSLKILFITFVINIGMGIPLSFLLYYGHRSIRSFIRVLLLIPVILPPSVIGYFLLFTLNRKSFVGQFFNQLEFSFIFNFWGVVIATTFVSLPLMIFSYLTSLENVDSKYVKTAQSMNHSRLTIAKKIIFPLSLNGLFAALILSLMRSLGEFGATLMFAGNIEKETETIPLAIYNAVLAGDDDLAFSLSLLLLAIGIFSIIGLTYFRRSKL